MSYERVKEINVEGVVLPNVPLSNIELLDAVKKLKIPNFRGVFLRDELPKRPRVNECGILNLDDCKGSSLAKGWLYPRMVGDHPSSLARSQRVPSGGGTHWVGWIKRQNENIYFDSYGLPPPTEILKYLRSPAYYNSERIQPDNEVFCGHLCLYVLKKMYCGLRFQEVINTLF
jgi:hypothetical protein